MRDKVFDWNGLVFNDDLHTTELDTPLSWAAFKRSSDELELDTRTQ